MERRHAISAVLGALGAAALPRAARAAAPLRVATLPVDPGAEVFYAKDLGYFRDAGLELDVQTLPNGGAIAAAVAGGSIDIGFSNLISLAEAYQRGVPVRVIAPGSLYTSNSPTTALVVPKSSTLKTARDCDGKTIAVPGLKQIVQYGTQLWIDKNGGNSSTVHFIEMSFPQINVAIQSSRVDVGLVAEPFTAEAQQHGRLFAAPFDAIAPRFVIGCWFAMMPWIAAHPDQVRAFRNTIFKTAAWANGHKPQSGEILAKYSKLTPETLKRMLRVDYAIRFDRAEMQPVVDVAVRYAGVKAPFPVEQILYQS